MHWKNTCQPTQPLSVHANMSLQLREISFRELRPINMEKLTTLSFKLNYRKSSRKKLDLSSSSKKRLLNSRLLSKSILTRSEQSRQGFPEK